MTHTATIRLDFAGHGPTIPPLLVRDAGIAQLVEHDLAKVGVASSSLVSRSKFNKLATMVRDDGFVGYRSAIWIKRKSLRRPYQSASRAL